MLAMLLILAALTTTANAQIWYAPSSTNYMYAYCIDQYGNIVPNCNLSLIGNDFLAQTNSHYHDYSQEPQTYITPTYGYTGYTGVQVTIQTTRTGRIEYFYACSDMCYHNDT
jgi:hypothetical protein